MFLKNWNSRENITNKTFKIPRVLPIPPTKQIYLKRAPCQREE